MSGSDTLFLLVLLILAAYLTGAIPTGYLAGRLLKGIDLRDHGSGNLGATNVFRNLGATPAILVLLFDMFKGFAPVFWFPLLAGPGGPERMALTAFRLVLGLAAILGHMFSPFVRFKGGKGVATAAGIFLALAPQALGLCLAVWIVLMSLFRIVSVASLGAALALPVAVFLTTSGQHDGDLLLRGFSLFVAAVVVYSHRGNISRLIRGEEKRLTRGRDPEGRA